MAVPSEGGKQPVVVDAKELRSLAQAARSARAEVDHTLARVAGIMGTLDRRGWNASAADGVWWAARSDLLKLKADLEQHATVLEGRAELVDRFETGQLSGDEAWHDTGDFYNQVELTGAGIPNADDPNAWDPILPWSIVPNAASPYAIEIALERAQVQQFLSPVEGIDLSNRQGDPWNIALDGLKLVLKAAGDSPSQCNDAFLRMAQAVRGGPDAVRDAQDALQRSRPECFLSRTQMRLTGFLADGTPIDLVAESTLDQFAVQMAAMADSLGAGGSGAGRWTTAQGRMNDAKGKGFENVLDSIFRRLGKFPFFRPTLRKGGFDAVTLEQGAVVINETLLQDVVVNEAKFKNKLQYADFTAITVKFRTNVQEVIDSLPGSTNLSASDKELVQNTLEGYLRDGTAPNLRVRVVTGKGSVGTMLQAKLARTNPGLAFEFLDVEELLGITPADITR